MSDRNKDKSFLSRLIRGRRTLLTIGLDTDIKKLPAIVQGDALEFNRAIIDATRDACIAYKLNFAFYESQGLRGWETLQKTIDYIGHDHFIIADAKRGDIGNTSAMYAQAVFDVLGCDAITVNPYMGQDCVTPFRGEGRWVILLALTSNPGSNDFQKKKLANGKFVYEEVMEVTSQWGSPEDTMYVIGATHPSDVEACRKKYPHHFFLIPGIGAQGGDLEGILQAGINADGGLLINASRSILYASGGSDFAEKARREGDALNDIIRAFLPSI